MQEKSLIKKKILQYLELKGISKYKFYQETGIARGVLDQNNGLTEENIFKILAWARDISPNWLLTSDDHQYPQQVEQIHTVNDGITIFKNGKGKENGIEQRVPLFNIKAVAGVVAIFESLKEQTPMAYLQIPNLPKCDGAVHIVGDSMYPLLKSGDIVAYKTVNNLDNIFWGEMYLLSIVSDGDAFITVKYLQKSDREGFVRLVSQNQHHQDKEMPLDSIKFAAIVKASIRINSMG